MIWLFICWLLRKKFFSMSLGVDCFVSLILRTASSLSIDYLSLSLNSTPERFRKQFGFFILSGIVVFGLLAIQWSDSCFWIANFRNLVTTRV